jgi:hypothetical protein
MGPERQRPDGLNTVGETNVPAGLSNVIAIAGGANGCLALIGNEPPVQQAFLSNTTVGSNSFSVTVPTQSGRVYYLEYKKNLGDTNWTALPLNFGTGANIVLTDTNATNAGRFYRVRRW